MTRIIAIGLTVLALAGCSTMGGNFCDLAAPIRPSSQDQLTDDLARQILANNRTGEDRCGWRP